MSITFEDSQIRKSIHKHYGAIKEKSVRIKEAELPMLEAIMYNDNFDKIYQTFTAI